MDEHKQTESIGYNKLIKGCGVVVAVFFVMCWVLDQTAKNDAQVTSALVTTATTQITPPPEPEPAIPKVEFYYYTPQELQNEFKANEVRITHKLNGNVLVLKGKISDISLSLGRPVIEISIPNSYDTINVYFDKFKADQISELNVGDVVKVGSRDVSLSPFGIIHLRDSSLLNDIENK